VIIHGSALLTIALMALVTYAMRAGGYWLVGRFTLTPRLEAALISLPGAVLISLVVPAIVREPDAGIPAMIVCALLMRWRGNLFIALVGGVFTVWLVRALI
jgi:uncharacterized membrane protein